MKTIENARELRARIFELEMKKTEEGIALKEEVSGIVKELHPVKLLTHGFKELMDSPEVKNELLGVSLGMSAGFIAKKLVVGKSGSVVQQIIGNVLGLVVSKNVVFNSDKIKSVLYSVLKNFSNSNGSGTASENSAR